MCSEPAGTASTLLVAKRRPCSSMTLLPSMAATWWTWSLNLGWKDRWKVLLASAGLKAPCCCSFLPLASMIS